MVKNIVVFGMAHSGKSTCIGYMYNRTREKDPNYNFEDYIARLKEELEEYDDSRDYGYLVDEFIEERKRTKASSGQSKKIHLKPIEIGGTEIIVIDTPGSEHKTIQRQKGMYYGEIGVFCIEAKQLTSEDFFIKKRLFSAFMATMMLWSKFNRRTIIALTKMDQCDYREDVYNKAREMIKQLCEMVNVAAIIPISVDVKGRKAHNVCVKSPEMPWYKGNSLEDELTFEIARAENKQNNTPLLFYVDRSYVRSQQYTGQSWRVKILQGELSVGQEIKMSPVRVNGEVQTIRAKIKSIRSDLERAQKEPVYVSFAPAGSFVGIDLCEIRLGNRKIHKEDLKTLNTSCGFSYDMNYKIADQFKFRTNFVNVQKANLGRQMDVLWFGRAITFQVCRREVVMNGVEIVGKLENRWITMPMTNDGQFLIRDLIIRYDNNPNVDPFLEAELMDIFN